MSLLHRLSLPSRGFMRDKSQDEEPSQSKFSNTVHIGQPGPFRRANLSSAFSTLFEKTENRRDILDLRESDQGADDLPLLGSRRENIPPNTAFKYPHTHESEDPCSLELDRGPLGQGSKYESPSKLIDIEPLNHLSPGIFSRVTHHVNNMPKTRSLSPSSNETNDAETREDEGLFPTDSTNELEGVRSISSSYPSEGMRSPLAGCRSPEPTSTADKYIAKYWRYGKYPSRSSWRLSSLPGSEASYSVSMGIQKIRAALASSDTMPSPVAPDQNANLRSSPFHDPVERCIEPICLDATGSNRASDIVHRIEKNQEPSFNSAVTVPILKDETAISSQLDGRFTVYRNPSTRCTSNHDQLGGSNAGSTDRPRRSVETNETALTAVRHPSISERDDTWSTIYDTGARPLSHHTSWKQLFTLHNSNSSSRTLAQRLQKLRLRKWVRRVCFKAKARFELVGRPIPSAKLSSAKTPRRIWRRMNKRKAGNGKKGLGRKLKRRWGVGRSLAITKRREAQQKTTTDRFLDSLSTKKSLQLRFYRLGMESQVPIAHTRAQSCPADMGL